MAGEGLAMQNAWDQAWKRDGKCHVQFHKQTVLDVRATEGYIDEKYEESKAEPGVLELKRVRHAGAGRPIYKELDYVRIFIPGDQFNVIDREVKEEDKLEYEKEWMAYVAGHEQSASGTPLEAWPLIPRPIVEELKHFHVRTVEDLAALADIHAQKFAGIVTWKQKARDFLQAAQSAAPIAEMRSELQQRDHEIAALKEQLAEMRGLMESATAPKIDKKDSPPRR